MIEQRVKAGRKERTKEREHVNERAPASPTRVSAIAYARIGFRNRSPFRPARPLPIARPPMNLERTRLDAHTLLPNARPACRNHRVWKMRAETPDAKITACSRTALQLFTNRLSSLLLRGRMAGSVYPLLRLLNCRLRASGSPDCWRPLIRFAARRGRCRDAPPESAPRKGRVVRTVGCQPYSRLSRRRRSKIIGRSKEGDVKCVPKSSSSAAC